MRTVETAAEDERRDLAGATRAERDAHVSGPMTSTSQVRSESDRALFSTTASDGLARSATVWSCSGTMFDLLSHAARRADRVQRSLRATVEWSDALLTEDERHLLRRMAVFAGGFDLPAIKDYEIAAQSESRPMDIHCSSSTVPWPSRGRI